MVQSRVDVLEGTGRGVAAELLREFEVRKLALTEERVSRTITRCTNVAGVFVDELDCEPQYLVSNDPASPRCDGEAGPDHANNEDDGPRQDRDASHRVITSLRVPVLRPFSPSTSARTCPRAPAGRITVVVMTATITYLRSSLTLPPLTSVTRSRRLGG